ncbi:MAG: ABC transporter permease [Candidatus Omnitrophica bacterium]|nr:ABC transporter permease [Candidatus Omnitrophota bacterium]
MGYESWISYRYLTAKKDRFLSFLNFISVAGVAIGVMSLIVVTGVMTGFGNNLREKIIGTTPHIMIEKETGVKGFSAVQEELKYLEGIVASSPYIQGSVFLETVGQTMGVAVRGIIPGTEDQVTHVTKYLTQGNINELTGNKVFIGSELSRYFGYNVGDKITVISPGSGISGKEWRYELEIAGIFNTGMVDYDTNLVIVHFQQAQKIFNVKSDSATGIGIKLSNPNLASDKKAEIYKLIGYSYLVRSWIDINRNLFDALFLEKWGLFIILTLMVLVASFNIISTLIVTVTSKINDIGILQSIGATRRSIKKIFTRQGVYIGTLGTFWGVVLGLGISFILKNYVQVPQEIYSIDRVPVDIQLFDVSIIVIAAMMISYFATIFPAGKAGQLQPVEALRYE